MPRRKKIENVPFNSDLHDAAMRNLGKASAKQAAEFYTRESGMMRNLEQHIESSTKKIGKSIEVNAKQPLDDFFESGESGSKDMGEAVSQNITGAMDKMFSKLDAKSQKAGKQFYDNMTKAFKQGLPTPKPPTQSGGTDWIKTIKQSYHAQNLGPALKGAVHESGILEHLPGGRMLGPLMELSPKLLLAGSALTLVLAGIGKLFSALSHLQSITAPLFKSMAGNEAIQGFTADIGKLQIATRMSSEQVVELAQAMHQSGTYMTENREDFNKLLVTNSKAVRMFGVSSETAAEFSRTLTQSGGTAEDVEKTYDGLYKAMQEGRGTIADVSAALKDGISLWREYGGVSGMTAKQFSENTLKMSLAARAMNIDQATMSAQYQSTMDPMTRRRQATMMSNTLGGSASKNFMDLDTPEGQQKLMTAALTRMQSAQGSSFGKSSDELKQLGPERYQQAMMQRQMGLNQLEHYGVSKQMSGQLMSSYQAYAAKNHGANIQGYMNDVKSGKAGSASLQEGLAKLSETMPEKLSRIETAVEGIFNILAGGPFKGLLDGMSKYFDIMLDPAKALGLRGNTDALDELPKLFNILTPDSLGQSVASAIGNTVPGFVKGFMSFFQPLSISLDDVTHLLSSGNQMLKSMVDPFVPLISALGNFIKQVGETFHFGAQTTKTIDKPNKASTGFELPPEISAGIAGAKAFAETIVKETFNPTKDSSSKPVADQPATNAPMLNPDAMVNSVLNSVMPPAQAAVTPRITPPAVKSLPASPFNIADGFAQGQMDSMMGLDAGKPSVTKTPSAVNVTTNALANSLTSAVSNSAKQKFGWLSGAHESGNPATVADYMWHNRRSGKNEHNVAYGAWQMDARKSIQTPQHFAKWLKTQAPDIASQLLPNIGSAMAGKKGAFGQAWQNVSHQDPKRFLELQRSFMKDQYLSPLMKGYGSKLGKSNVLQEVAYSTSVQHGQQGASNILKRAGIDHLSGEELIKRVYQERDRATAGALHPRFQAESAQAVAALHKEIAEQHDTLKQIAGHTGKQASVAEDTHTMQRRGLLAYNPNTASTKSALSGQH